MSTSEPSAQAPAVALDSAPDPDVLGRQWVQILPSGSFKGFDGRGPFQVRNSATVIAESLRLAERTGGHIHVDYDHATDLHGASRAAGWIERMEEREGAMWAEVRWTEAGLQDVKGRAYRFLSPEILHNQVGDVGAIQRVSLTNNPNLTMKALNRAEPAEKLTLAAFSAKARQELGVGDGDWGDVLSALQRLKGRVAELQALVDAPDPSRFVPMDMFQKTAEELRRTNQGISRNTAERMVDRAIEDRQIMPFMRDWAVSLCSANKPAFDDFVERMGRPMRSIFEPRDWSAHQQGDRSGARAAQGVKSEFLQIAQSAGLSEEDVAKYAPKR